MPDINQPYLLADANLKTVLKTNYKVAVLPWGATEAHNYHLPYATDNIQVDYIAKKAGGAAHKSGTNILILPCIPFGINTGQLDVKFCMNLLPSTQLAVLRDTVDVLNRHGVEKLVILNGHGGNNFKNMIRELSLPFPNFFITWVNWYQVVDWHLYFEEAGDDAGEMETSAVMHIRPDLVRPLSEAGDGKEKKLKLRGFQEGWATTQRQWTKVTQDTGVGNPQKSSAEKGKKYLDDICGKLSQFLIELDKTPSEELYE